MWTKFVRADGWIVDCIFIQSIGQELYVAPGNRLLFSGSETASNVRNESSKTNLHQTPGAYRTATTQVEVDLPDGRPYAIKLVGTKLVCSPRPSGTIVWTAQEG